METSHYVIIEKATGKPVRLSRDHNGSDRYACGEYRYSLVPENNPNLPIFTCKTADEAVEVLNFPPEWYNSTAESPMLGYFDKEELSVALMEVRIKPVDVGEPLVIGKGVHSRRSLPYIVAKRIAPEAPSDKSLSVIVFDTKKAGVTVEQLKAKIGYFVYFSDSQYDKRVLYGFSEARDEWREFGDLELVCS
jgi:hypothetical protein